MVWIILTVLGLCLGSFVNAWVWRVHEQGKGKNLSVLKGRSQCPHCHHELAAKDLIPVFSWLFLRGRCRYCGEPISKQYPLVELALAGVFTVSYAYWPGGFYGLGAWVLLLTWMAVSVGLLALFVYDLKWMLLPNQILYPTLAVAAGGRLIYLVSFEPDIWHGLIQWGLSILIASGIFWLIFTLSDGRLIGYGDVRLGLVLGTVLASAPKSLLMIFVASVLGVLAALPGLLSGKKGITSKLPYGPFLITATMLVLIFGDNAIDRYRNLLS